MSRSTISYESLAQISIDADPFNVTLRDREAACIAEFNQAVLMEERFLKQKAKIQWGLGMVREVSDKGGNDVIAAVREFFRNGTILKELNHTIITLIPKVKSPSRVKDYRLFLAPKQSAFVPGYCSKLDLINLCFADDLFLFAYGDVNSASIIKDTLDEFKNVSGLVPSIPKSTAYFCNVLNHVKLAILHVLPFEEGRLCRLIPWCAFSFIETYGKIFFGVMALLGIKGSQGCLGDVCLPKEERRAGYSEVECFKLGLLATHVWKLLILKDSLWVKWIHEYKLKGRSFWDYPLRVKLLRGGNNSMGTECRAGAGEAGAGDTLPLLGGGPKDDDGEDRGLLWDGPKRGDDSCGEDRYATIQSSILARIDGGKGG
ncbi:hypothetical protein Tco_0710022 [Tanacetum coccineum]